MHLTFRPFDRATDESAAVRLYEEAFPVDERRPTPEWRTLLCHESPMRGFTLEADRLFAGFITLWQLHGFVYGEHFAISETLRGQGLGTTVFKEAFKMAGTHPLVIEVEPPHASRQAARRIRFYRRCGMSLCRKPYLQPPYASGLRAVPLRLMCDRPTFLRRHFDTICAQLHEQVYGIPPDKPCSGD